MKSKLQMAGGILLFLCIVLMSTCTKVGPKEAAFRVNNAGNYRGVSNIDLVTGYQWYVPGIQHIEKVGTYMHHIVWSDDKNEGTPEDQSITVFCNGGAGFHINVGLNVSVIPAEAPRMWLRWKTIDVDDIMKTYIRNVVRGNMQNVASTMSVDSVLNKFTTLEAACSVTIRDSLRNYGFHVDGFNILSKPKATDPKLEEAINGKIIARQLSEKETMNIQIHQAQALQKAADARGDSSYNVIEAMGKAEAIKVLQAQITPTYVEYVKWNNAGEDVPRVPQYQGVNGILMK